MSFAGFNKFVRGLNFVVCLIDVLIQWFVDKFILSEGLENSLCIFRFTKAIPGCLFQIWFNNSPKGLSLILFKSTWSFRTYNEDIESEDQMAMRLVRKHGYMFWFARCLGRRVLVSSSTQQFGGRGNCLKGRRIFDTFGAGRSLAWLTLYNISIHVLQTVLCTLTKLLTKIILTIEGLFSWWSSPQFSWLSCLIQGWYCMEKLDASHS